MSHFNPGHRAKIGKDYETPNCELEASKSNFTTALIANQSCMTKCNLTDASFKMDRNENDCMRQCFVKYFDAQLLIENEMTNFVRGIDL